VWLAHRQKVDEARRAGRPIPDSKGSVARIFKPDLFWTTAQTTLVIGSFMCIYYSVNFWYPTFLREGHREVLPYLALFNVGAIIGTAAWGRLSETRLGRRGAVTITVILTQSVFIFNDFVNPLYFLPGDENATVQLTLFNFLSQFSTQYNLLFMDIVLVTLPPLVLFIFFNRKIVAGMTSGAVKG